MSAPTVDVRDMLCAQALAVVGGALKRLAPGEPVVIQYNAADVREDLVRWAADRGDFAAAVRKLERAVAEAAEPATRTAILGEIDRIYWEWGASAPGSGRGPGAYICAACNGGLVVDCERCGGKGTVQATTKAQLDPSTGRMTPARTQDVPCPTCKGALRVPCAECKSTGLAVETLPSGMRSSIVKLALTMGGGSGAIKKIQVADALDRLAGESRKVDVPVDLAVAYGAGRSLRDMLGASPFARPAGPGAVDLQKAWEGANETDRLGFLLGVGFEYALARATWESIGPQESFTEESKSQVRGPTPVLDASAGMRALADQWVRVEGVWTGTADRPGSPFAREVDLEGDVAIAIVYYPSAGLAWLKTVSDAEAVRSPGLAKVLESYPKDLDAALRAIPAGERVVLTGRVRFYPDRSPIGVLEVWSVRSLGRPAAVPEPVPSPVPEEPGEPVRPDPRPEPEPEPRVDPPAPEPRPAPVRGDRTYPPVLDGRPAGALAEEARDHLARAQQVFVESGATDEVRREVEAARELFAAALAADPENRYLDDVLFDLDEFAARLR